MFDCMYRTDGKNKKNRYGNNYIEW
jgi:hypothetical protein